MWSCNQQINVALHIRRHWISAFAEMTMIDIKVFSTPYLPKHNQLCHSLLYRACRDAEVGIQRLTYRAEGTNAEIIPTES